MRSPHLIFWETIARLAGVKNPGQRAALVMRKWGRRVITSDAAQEIIADLTSEHFPAQLTGADIGKLFQLNPQGVRHE